MKQYAIAFLTVLSISSAGVARSPGIGAAGSDPSREQWIAAVSRELEGALRSPVTFRDPAPSGAVAVTFNCSDSGRPSAVKVLRRSGDVRLDRAAVAAIQRIKTLHPLPAGIGTAQLFQANIVFADDERDLARTARIFRTASAPSAPALAGSDAASLVIGVGVLRKSRG